MFSLLVHVHVLYCNVLLEDVYTGSILVYAVLP